MTSVGEGVGAPVSSPLPEEVGAAELPYPGVGAGLSTSTSLPEEAALGAGVSLVTAVGGTEEGLSTAPVGLDVGAVLPKSTSLSE